MTGGWWTVLICVVVLASLYLLLRRKNIREKYAFIWIVVAIGIIILGAVPGVATWLSNLVGIIVPANLVFAIAAITLLIVVIHLSIGVSQLEEKVRTLAEEIALLRLDTEQQASGRVAHHESPGHPDGPECPEQPKDPSD
ncbi:MAG: DUF2304 domain-containing protein [Promicromonosporaceae bacterium]|nr:DUF2304 domain-containing protein [Promicromonosporaceae bacterium]